MERKSPTKHAREMDIGDIEIGKNTQKYFSYYKKLFTGSSILIETKENEYIFIGNKIFIFKSIEPVEEFHSIMGNSSVVYPFALTKNYSYLMIEGVYVEGDFTNQDPYEFYYDFNKTNKPKYNTFRMTILDK